MHWDKQIQESGPISGRDKVVFMSPVISMINAQVRMW